MNLKKLFKGGVKLVIECEANPVTIVMRLSKKQMIAVLDYIIPDDPEPKELKPV